MIFTFDKVEMVDRGKWDWRQGGGSRRQSLRGSQADRAGSEQGFGVVAAKPVTLAKQAGLTARPGLASRLQMNTVAAGNGFAGQEFTS
ncbi:hypothetical protein [Novosphingobium sp. RL4]|uniref:hypothetical protein n=1 Tax=Novosphingobium sp. RL4 TaxID=3109595 RepID=UPI002D787D2C|nr:hypothetical protein [Novosphingobium sp. RL4]WRT94365.1 hypothetical protein U9J33_07655 [Novosphingobium sp. RL4]